MAILTDYYTEFFKELDRQGPGDDKYTELAFRLLDPPPDHPRILDVGSGTGRQSLTLARIAYCEITAVDVFDAFLNILNKRAKKNTLKGTISTRNASMFELPFEDQMFDVIWSEGSIYIMGFEKGLKAWKRLLNPGGYLVVSEIVWLQRDIPEEIRDYWNTVYPEIGTVSEKLAVIETCDYQVLAHMTLPQYAWEHNYYGLMEARKKDFLNQYGDVKEARRIVESEMELESNLFKNYKDYYGYVFFIMRKK